MNSRGIPDNHSHIAAAARRAQRVPVAGIAVEVAAVGDVVELGGALVAVPHDKW